MIELKKTPARRLTPSDRKGIYVYQDYFFLQFCHSLNPNIIPENTAPIRSILQMLNASYIPKAQPISIYRATSATNRKEMDTALFILSSFSRRNFTNRLQISVRTWFSPNIHPRHRHELIILFHKSNDRLVILPDIQWSLILLC